ncbi:MAG: ParA family protein [Sarcina sp.]
MKIIAFVNQKGGVGKTTLSINIAAILAEQGKKVLIIDNDSQSNVTSTFFDYEPVKTLYNVLLNNLNLKEIINSTKIKNLDIAVNSIASSDINLLLSTEIAREMKLKNVITEAQIKYDYIIIDCNPALDLSLINALVATNEVIIPIDCSAYSLTGLNNLLKFIEKLKIVNKELKINGFILNNVDRRTTTYKDIIEAIHQYYPNMLFENYLGMNSIYSKMQFAKETIIENKTNKAFIELNAVIKEMNDRW